MSDQPNLLTLSEAARFLNVSKASLRRWTNSGLLPCYRVGVRGARRFARADLERFARTERGGGSRMVASGGRAVSAVDRGASAVPQIDHPCLFFSGEDDLWESVRDRILAHARAGHPILYVCDTTPVSRFRERLEAAGVDVDGLSRTGRLRVLHSSAAYLSEGRFSADRMCTFMADQVRAWAEQGHETGLISGEMTWYLSGAEGVEEMFRYEETLNDLLLDHPGITIICSYSLPRFDAAAALRALLSHPAAEIGGQRLPGFYRFKPSSAA
jgi:excisionase family DNA binding protein